MTVKLHTLKEKEVRKDRSQDIPKISGLMWCDPGSLCKWSKSDWTQSV